jgi:hypothetical protein
MHAIGLSLVSNNGVSPDLLRSDIAAVKGSNSEIWF